MIDSHGNFTRMSGHPETAGYEPVSYTKKQRSGLQFSFETLVKVALLASLFIPLVLYKAGQPVAISTVIIATVGGVSGVVYFFARWTEGAYDAPPPRRDRRDPK